MSALAVRLWKGATVKRMVVAAILAAVVLGVLVYPVPWLVIFALVAMVVAYFEVANMAGAPVPQRVRDLLRLPKVASPSGYAWGLGVVVALGMVAFVLCNVWYGKLAVTLLAGITLTDAFAWAGGTIYGKVMTARGLPLWRFAPSISPNKTWVGTLVGVVGGVVAAQPFAALLGFGVDPTPNLYAMLFVVAAAGVIGDLLESYVKRCVGIKDTSGLLPGHGGAVDRLDSITFAFLVLAMFQVA